MVFLLGGEKQLTTAFKFQSFIVLCIPFLLRRFVVAFSRLSHIFHKKWQSDGENHETIYHPEKVRRKMVVVPDGDFDFLFPIQQITEAFRQMFDFWSSEWTKTKMIWKRPFQPSFNPYWQHVSIPGLIPYPLSFINLLNRHLNCYLLEPIHFLLPT